MAGFEPASLKKKRKQTPTQVLSSAVWETFKNTYFEEQLQTAASGGA